MKPALAESPIASPKNISGISVIFDWGAHERGNCTGHYAQADVVDGYGNRLIEELEYENVRTLHVDTRKAPFRTEEERLAEVPAGYIPIFLSCDWHKNLRTTNSSSIEFCGPELYKLADDLGFSLAEWGRAYVFEHRVVRPVVTGEGRSFIRIKPFALNGPHADEYIRRLDKLGEDLGRVIGEYLRTIGQGLRR